MGFLNFFKKQDKEKRGLLKKGSLFIFIIFLIFASFTAGIYVEQNSEYKGRDVISKDKKPDYEHAEKDKMSKAEKEKDNVNFELYWELWETLKNQHVDHSKINDSDFFYGSLKGMAASLGDPYTVFMDPESSNEFESELLGTFEGIGCEVGMRDDILTVIAPLEGSPAKEAGLAPRDRIIEVDGESTANMSIDEAVNRIRGEKGTKVTLTIYRKSSDKTMDIEITRDEIYVKSVNTEMKENDLFLLEINSFNDDTLSLFNKAVDEILEKDPKGVILDLRSNPGGFLDTSIEVASEWVESGEIVSEVFAEGEGRQYNARGRARLKDYPTVVLVNGGSASASEIVAGALQDHDAAEIVGEQTFGKGSVQVWEGFSDGSSVKITVAKWLTPSGNSINDDGIEPDEKVEYELEDFEAGKDPQMEKAEDILINKINN